MTWGFESPLAHVNHLNRRGFLLASGAGAALLSTASTAAPAADPQGADETGNDDGAPASGELIIGAVSAVGSLDPGLAVDTETERICRQIFEPLIGIDQETGGVAPLLAEDWETSADGLTCTLRLREGVTFHDGTELTAEVVVANFERWGQLDYLYGFGTIASSTPLAFPTVFGGFLDQETCVLESVEAEDDHTVVLTLSEPVAYLLQALTQPAFGIAAESVLSESDPGLVSRNPVGTGCYQLAERAEDERSLRLTAFEDYWGESPAAATVTVRALGKSFDRLRELNRGRLDVYDHITADNLRPLVQAGRLILQRDPFSILYLGLNLEHPVIGQHEVREAIARSVRRSALIESLLLDGSRSAFQFTPPALAVHSDDAPRYDRSLTTAAELLEEAGYDGEPLRFYYPMATTRSWLPRPEAVYASLARDLTEAGLVIEPRPVRWDDGYVEEMLADDDRALHLMGRNGGFRSPHSFFGPIFGQNGLGMPSREFHYQSEEAWDLMDQARAEQDDEARDELYRELAEVIAEDIPAVPLAYPISGLALGQRVSDYPMSPVLNERFADVALTDTD
ncbi:ABC transporter substrate-binding protein [Nesterenkonia populi]